MKLVWVEFKLQRHVVRFSFLSLMQWKPCDLIYCVTKFGRKKNKVFWVFFFPFTKLLRENKKREGKQFSHLISWFLLPLFTIVCGDATRGVVKPIYTSWFAYVKFGARASEGREVISLLSRSTIDFESKISSILKTQIDEVLMAKQSASLSHLLAFQ